MRILYYILIYLYFDAAIICFICMFYFSINRREIMLFHLPVLIMAFRLFFINLIFLVNLLNTVVKLILFFFKCICEARAIVSRNSI